MATQGLVTIKTRRRVLVKVVAGCDGMKARQLAGQLKVRWPLTASQIYREAVIAGFGSPNDLVVITKDEVIYKGDDELGPLYDQTFQQPRFNPRWVHGTADHVVVVRVKDKPQNTV